MTDSSTFKLNTTYVIYVAATPDQVWQALTDPILTRQYFGGMAVDVTPKVGGAFRLLYPDGRTHISGRIVEWLPAKRFSCTWLVEGVKEIGQLPECLVTYAIEPAGEAIRLTVSEAHSWDVPESILAGGREGWPAILSGLKSMLETGRAPKITMAPPVGFMEAVQRAVAEQPWLKN
jgi:uncharacterized protein YndB with AHSA1/START domain